MTTKRYITVADTAKLVRSALKQAFPTVKFSVKSKSYSGGASISVGWTDGPTQKQVEAVTSQFTGASFDGMIDLKSYHTSQLNGETVHFGADYIFCNRNYSVGFMQRRADSYCKKMGIAPITLTPSRYAGQIDFPHEANEPVFVHGYYEDSLAVRILRTAHNCTVVQAIPQEV